MRDLSFSLVLIGLSKTLIFYFFQGFLTSTRIVLNTLTLLNLSRSELMILL